MTRWVGRRGRPQPAARSIWSAAFVVAALVTACSSDDDSGGSTDPVTATSGTSFASTEDGSVQCWIPERAIEAAIGDVESSLPGPVYVYPAGPGQGEPIQIDGCNYTVGSGDDLWLISSGQTDSTDLFDESSARDTNTVLGEQWNGARDGFAYSLRGGGTRWIVVSGRTPVANDDRLIDVLEQVIVIEAEEAAAEAAAVTAATGSSSTD